MTDLSVIIPVYNVEKYLRKCLDSVVNQTFKDIEIICVNDGSTDNSLSILNEFAQKDSRIKIINKENEGVSAAWNSGLDIVSSKYVGFVDADDWIEPETFETAYNAMINNDVDYVCFGANIVQEYESDTVHAMKKYLKIKYKGKTKVDSKVIQKTPATMWGKIFKTSIIKDKNIRFTSMSKNEDTAFWLMYSVWAKNGYYINKCFYHYVQRQNSIMGTKYQKLNKSTECLKLIPQLVNYYNENNLTKKYFFMLQKQIKSFVYLDYFNSSEKSRGEILQQASEIFNGLNLGLLNNSLFIKALKNKQYNKLNFVTEYGLAEKLLSVKKTPDCQIYRFLGLKLARKRIRKSKENK